MMEAQTKLRPFEDLIKTIEYDGEAFVPIEEIAKMALGKKIKKSGIGIIKRVKICYINHKNKEGLVKQILVDRNFNVMYYCVIDIDMLVTKNQVQIVKNLIKWGFIEP